MFNLNYFKKEINATPFLKILHTYLSAFRFISIALSSVLCSLLLNKSVYDSGFDYLVRLVEFAIIYTLNDFSNDYEFKRVSVSSTSDECLQCPSAS